MARVTLSLPAPAFALAGQVGWGGATSGETFGDLRDLAAVGGEIPLLRFFGLSNLSGLPRTTQLFTTESTTEDPDAVAGPELSAAWEGSAVAVTVQAPTLPDLVVPGSATGETLADSTEPYRWRLSAAQDAAAYAHVSSSGINGWINDFRALTAEQQAGVTLILDDGVPVEQFGDADPLVGEGSFGEPSGFATAQTPPLVLADSDDTGLEVDCKALLVASDDATAGNFFYEDADRGGTDTPLDGELGLGDDDTVISGIRRRTATLLQLNDNNNPVALDIGAYFSAGGAGADLTIYLQTLAGEVSFPASAASFSRVDQVRFTLPSDAQTLLDGLLDGDRWIFKAARPEVITQTGDADPLVGEGAFGEPTGFATAASVERTGDADPLEGVGSFGEPSGFASAVTVITRFGDADPLTGEGAFGEPSGFVPVADIKRGGSDPLVGEGSFGEPTGFATAAPTPPAPVVVAAPEVLVNGLRQDGVQQPSIRVHHAIAKTSTASFTLRGRLDAIPIPAYGDSVEIRDVSGETVFSGFVRTPDPRVSDFGAFLSRATVRCQGHNDALRYRRIHGTEGVEIVEAADGAAQFSGIVALLAGYTGATDLDANSVAIRTDIRYQTAASVLRALAIANDAILHVTTARQVRLFQRGNLPASALGRLGAADLFQYSLLRDPRKVRSRQILRYGDAEAQRTIAGDGATRDFLVAGTQTAVDYMADGSEARLLNSDEGDQGLRMRADADAEARTGGGIDFFGGNAGVPGSGLYVGPTLAGASGIALRMLTNGNLQLRAGTTMAAAANYGIALRHDGAGMPVWTSDGIAPTVNQEGAATPERDMDFDFEMPSGSTGDTYAEHGNTRLSVSYVQTQTFRYGRVRGSRVTGNVLVRDTRFDVDLTDNRIVRFAGAVVVGNTLHVFRRHLEALPNYTIRSDAYNLGAGSITRNSAHDVDVPISGGNLEDSAVVTDGAHVWFQTSRSSNQRWDAFPVVGQGLGNEDIAQRKTFTMPDTSSSLGETGIAILIGDWMYMGAGSGTEMRRIAWSSATPEPDTLGVALSAGQLFRIGPLLFSMGFASTARATRIESDFLEWDAPSSAYQTLNNRRQSNAGFRVAVIDPDVIGASVPSAEFAPIPVDVRSVTEITLNGTRENLGDGETWRFDRARQKLIQDPAATALTATDSLVVDYAAQAIAQACDPGAAVMRDHFTDLRDSEGLAFDDALETAKAFLDRYGTLTDRLSVEIRDNAEIAREAETVQFDAAMLRALGLTDAADSDRWLIYDVQFRWDGDIRIQRAECQRGEFRERSVDWWRERDGDA